MPRYRDPETKKFISEEEAKRRNIEAERNGLNFNESFEEYVNQEAKRTGMKPQEIADEIFSSEFAIVEFDEAKGTASMKIYSGQDKPIKDMKSEVLMEEYRDLRENFAPVSAGIEYHKSFLCGSGFDVITNDPKDDHKIKMCDEIREFCKNVHMDYYRNGLDKLLYILADDLLTYGMAAAEIIYGKEIDFDDFAEQEIIINDKGKKEKVWTTRLPNVREWKSFKGIKRLKIIDNAYSRLIPYEDLNRGEIKYWTLDEKTKKSLSEEIAEKAGVKGKKFDGSLFHPFEIFWLSWNTRGTNLKGESIIRPALEIARLVRRIQRAIGKGFDRWADKKYFFVCVPPTTEVWTPEGYEQIKDIQVGNSVWSEHSTAEVLQTFKTPYKGDLITVKPKMLEETSFTPNHPIKVAQKKRLGTKEGHKKYLTEFSILDGYKRADELTTDDFLIVPKIKENHDIFVSFEDLSHKVGMGYGRNPNTLPSQFLSEDLAKLFGWYLAEGSINSNDYYTIQFSLNIDEGHYAQEILDLAWNTLGLKGKIYKNKENNSLQVVFCSKVLATFLDLWFGHGANSKHLPHSFLYWKQEFLYAMLSRILMGDGYLGKDNWWNLKLNSRTLIKQLQLVLLKLGHMSSFTQRLRPKVGYIQGRKINQNDAWILRWNENNKVISEDINNYYFKIHKITKTPYDGYVYNLHVDGVNEYYLPFRTHNCGTERRTWNKNAQRRFVKYLELMIKNHWTGVPVPAGFDVKEIGGQVFEGTNILNHLINMICFVPNTPILANPEIKNIQDLNVGDKVLTHDGSFQPITKTMVRNFDGKLMKIQPHYSMPIKVTPNHPFKVFRNGKEEWIDAANITKNDYVVFPKPKLNIMENPFNYNLTEEFMEFLGYYIGDGYTKSNHPYKNVREWIYISIDRDHKKQLLRLTELVTKFAKRPRISIVPRKGTNVIVFGFKDEHLADTLHKICGTRSWEKQIPESIMGMTRIQFNSLWEGLTASDGHIRPDNQRFYSSTSQKLIGQIYLLMSKFDTIAYIRMIPKHKTKFSKTKGGKTVFARKSWQIITNYPNPSKMVIIKRDRIYIPILRIEKENYNGKVYNFSVANNETYTTFGALVHNCAAMNYPRDFLEQGRTRSGDKSWLAWQVKYGSNQRMYRRDVENQLFQKHLWCNFGKKYRVPKQSVPKRRQERKDIYVPKIMWKAEGRWQKAEEMGALQGWLNVANPVGPEFKLAIEKRGAELLGFGSIEFPSHKELRKQIKLEAKLQELQIKKAMEEAEQPTELKPKMEDKLKTQQKNRQEGGVSIGISPTGKKKKAPPKAGSSRKGKTIKKGMPSKS